MNGTGPADKDRETLAALERVVERCDCFEAAWRAGRQPRIEDYLDEAPEPEQASLLRELLALELELRRSRGERPEAQEYRTRFPEHASLVIALFAEGQPPSPRQTGRPKEGRRAADADRGVLLGLLALQYNFVGHDALLAAFTAWVADKSRPLGQILRERGALDADTYALLEALVGKHLDLHAGDPERSLAALSSLGPARQHLERIADPELHASLAHVAADRGTERDPDATRTHAPDPAPAPAGRFRIVRFHDRGGPGEVYVARDEERHRDVALKRIQERHADDPNSRAHFVVEAEITGGLEHPGIIPIYGLGTYDGGRPFYVMRFIKGDSLRDAIQRFHADDATGRDPGARSLALRQLLGRFLDVCNAVAYAHSGGVLNRDLKPGDILLGPYGETLVVDWGLAKVIRRPEGAAGSAEGTLRPASGSDVGATVPGSALGTPAYMSPEQAAGALDQLGPASDVYSLGATLYTLLTGRAPFTDPDPLVVPQQVVRGDFPPPRQVRRGVPRALEAICLKAMALRPEDRYASPRALADDLEHWLADEPVTALPESWGGRLARWTRRHRTWAQAGAALLLVTVISLLAAGLVNQARVLAEQRRRDADTQRGLAEERRREADRQRLNAERHLARLALDQGLNLCAQGDSPRGMLWLARALQIAPADADDLRQVIRLNLDAWSRQFHRLLGFVEHHSRVSEVAFSPDGKTLATAGDDGTARLWDVATFKPLGPPLKHQAGVRAMAFSPDGKTLATAGDDGTARLWDVATFKPLGPPLKHQAGVRAMAFSPDGKTLATAGEFAPARLWAVATLKPLGPPLKHQGWVTAVAFSPDGKTLATAGTLARLWDVATSQPLGPPLQHVGVEGLAFSPDGKTLATASRDTTARLWDVATLKPLGLPLKHQGPVMAVAFSPDGKTLATAGDDGTARLWDAATFEPLGPPLHHQAGPPLYQAGVAAVAFSPDGKTLATAGATARLWDAATLEPLGPPLKHRGGVRAVAFRPDGKSLATAGDDGTARLWDAATLEPLGPPLHDQAGVRAVAFSPDGKTLATAGDDGTARLWDAATFEPLGPPLHDQAGVEAGVEAVAFSPDGKTLATVISGDPDQTARLWAVATLKPLGPPLHQQGTVNAVAFSPDGKTLATAGTLARLWDVSTAQPLGPPLKHGDTVEAVAFSPDGKTLATASWDTTARLWDVATLKPLGPPLKHQGPVMAVAFSPDGKTLATVSADRTARLWAVTTAHPLGPPLLHQGDVNAAAFSPDGKTLATASDDGTARLWDAATAKPVGPPLKHQGRVEAVAFSPDGRTLVTASADTTARLWDVPAPMAGDPERIVLWAQVLSAMELDASDATHPLEDRDWEHRRRDLEKRGGPPSQIHRSPARLSPGPSARLRAADRPADESP